MIHINLVQALTQVKDFACLDFDVRSLPLGAAGGLMHHDAGVGQGKTLALGAGAEE